MASSKENPNNLHAGDMIERLRVKYPVSQYAFMAEVSNGTGQHSRRHADAVALGLWPSRGLELEGFEIKVARSDWLNELKKHRKAEAVQQYCQRWWIVAPRGIVKKDELPSTWGLLQEHGQGLSVVKHAPLNEDAKEMTRTFVAALLRRFSETMIPQSSVEPEIEKARKQADEQAKRMRKYERERHEELSKNVAEFEHASGIRIRHGWKLGDVGRAVALLGRLDGNNDLVGIIERMQNALEKEAEQLSDLIEIAKKMKGASRPPLKLKPSKIVEEE